MWKLLNSSGNLFLNNGGKWNFPGICWVWHRLEARFEPRITQIRYGCFHRKPLPRFHIKTCLPSLRAESGKKCLGTANCPFTKKAFGFQFVQIGVSVSVWLIEWKYRGLLQRKLANSTTLLSGWVPAVWPNQTQPKIIVVFEQSICLTTAWSCCWIWAQQYLQIWVNSCCVGFFCFLCQSLCRME